MTQIKNNIIRLLTTQEKELLSYSFETREALVSGVFGDLDEVERYLIQEEIDQEEIDLASLRDLQWDMIERISLRLELS